jgi:hypothetical protein
MPARLQTLVGVDVGGLAAHDHARVEFGYEAANSRASEPPSITMRLTSTG